MFRISIGLALVAAVLLAAPRGAAAVDAAGGAAADQDAAAIYTKFLDDWSGERHEPLNVAESAAAPTPEDLQKYTDCAREAGLSDAQWIPGAAIPALRTVLGRMRWIHYVDPEQWRPLDPGALMASGISVGAAVSAGMAQGLVTLSAISFNPQRDLAVFSFSFVCGSLCGNGRVVVFRKTANGWVPARAECGEWVS